MPSAVWRVLPTECGTTNRTSAAQIVPKREILPNSYFFTEFAEFVSVNMAGDRFSQVYEEGKAFNLIVRTKDEVRDDGEGAQPDGYFTGDGQKIPINYVAMVFCHGTEYHQP